MDSSSLRSTESGNAQRPEGSAVSTTKESSSSAPSFPSLSLPKGGGAIRGIGEKFAANPVTGAGTMTVPICASTGRSGSGPQMAISYSSNSGNGPFGFGWQMALQSVTRKTEKGLPQYKIDKGLPRYEDADESDTFVLTGFEDLTPGLVESGGKWTRDVTPSRALYGNQYAIHRYRPRVDNMFARIERWVNLADLSDTFWRSITRDNVTTWYGKTSASRITDPRDATRVFSWLICESYDDKGNVVSYEYKPEDSTGINLGQVNERNRTDATRAVNRYIKRVHYGNRTPYFPNLTAAQPVALPTAWCFQLVFDYGDHNPTNPTPQESQPWACRLDPFSSYRSTFEVRTYRLCQRVLMFHSFPEDPNVGNDCLVRSTDLTHASAPPPDPSQPYYSYLLSAAQTCYRPDGAGGYLSDSMPPLEFGYTQAVVDPAVRTVDPVSLQNLPYGMDGRAYRWIDLDGEGLSGILTEQAGSWFYKANLSPVNLQTINGKRYTLPRFAAMERVAKFPSTAALNEGRQQLFSVSGDGQLDLVDYAASPAGYYERTDDANWEPFTEFSSMPVLDWNNPQMKFIDLTGDGFPDLLISDGFTFRWHQSLATEGFSISQRVLQALDEELGPKLIFSDSTESIFLADLSGDGLTDLVRIRRREACYWPNRGRGCFGAKVTMDNAPLFDRADLFDGRKIRLADIDGSGTADIIYFAGDSVQLYFNQSGNGWGPAKVLNNFPQIDSDSPAEVLDFLGNGTACLVWSSQLPGNARTQMRYIDLMGGQKPHLLVRQANNMGAEVRIHYAPSTKFYVADKLAGTPWVTRLPFPVQVVERVETFDFVGRNLFVTRYAYHHGYYDGVEREFRGFGRVDQWDTEELATLMNSADMPEAVNWNAASNVPTTLTKTWYHTGAYFGETCISIYMQQEYYSEGDTAEAISGLTTAQFDAMQLDDTPLPSNILLPDGSRLTYQLSPEEMREACRALRGSMLRQEVYALDGTEAEDRPYSASESNYTIEAFQPQGPNVYGVFFSHAREKIEFNYERQLYQIEGNQIVGPAAPAPAISAADPRVKHSLTLAVDQYGNVLQSADVGYGRRYVDPNLTVADQGTQSTLLSTCAQSTYTNAVDSDDAHRAPVLAETIAYELLQVQPSATLPDITNLFTFDEMLTTLQGLESGAFDLPFEDLNPTGLTPGQAYRRLIGRKRSYYRPDDLGASAGNPRALLALGVLESLGLPGAEYKLAFTPGLITDVYQRGGSALLSAPATVLGSTATDGGGYVDLDSDGNWWIPSARAYFIATVPATPAELNEAMANFFVLCRLEDPFGNASTVDWDDADLLPVQTTDAVNNVVSSVNDYRVLRPSLITDANLNQAAVSFNVLELVTATAVMGKSGQNLGDTLTGFSADLAQADIDALYDAADPHTLAPPLLGNATSRFIYDIHGFANSRTAAPHDPTKWLPCFAATIAREIHVSQLSGGATSPLQISFGYCDGFGRAIQNKSEWEPGPVVEGGSVVNLRWVGSGWTIYNNKGNPVRKYEPFFSQLALSGHQFEFGVQVGVSPIVCYDPPGRVVATLYPNQSFAKVVFDPWHFESWDMNDTVLTDPGTDRDVGDYFRRLPVADYSPTWYAQRSGGALGATEQATATKAAAHANTPAVAYLDSLGRTFLSIADNGSFGKYLTHFILDIQNNQRTMIDPLSREAMSYDYSVPCERICQASMEAGHWWMLNDVAGKSIRAWDSRGHNLRFAYDALRRPLALYVLGTDPVNSDPRTLAGEVQAEATTYGEGQAHDQALNLRTHAYQHNDTAGVGMFVVTDPATQQQIAYDFKGNLLGSSRQFLADATLLPNWQRAAPAFGLDLFVSTTQYDALNRTVAATTPDGTVVVPTYTPANLLATLSANLQGAATATGFVSNIDYNAKAQRVLIDYGNNVSTAYSYDPLTFRLINLTTTRSGFPANQQTVQDLSYSYDPVSNITHIEDDADIQDVVFFRNVRVDPSADYTCDPVYRLILAGGREQLGLNGSTPLAPAPTSYNDMPRVGLLSPGDGNAMGTYTEQYQYDYAGNFTSFIHSGSDPANPGWSRTYNYNEASLLVPAQVSNRLSSTVIGGSTPFTEAYTYDPHGNMKSMPQLSSMLWDFKDRLLMTQRQAVNSSDGSGIQHAGQKTWYGYDATGQRVRKTTQSSAGVAIQERFYIGPYEVFRTYSAGAITLECHTLSIMDGSQRVVLVETTTTDTSVASTSLPITAQRYQYENHLGTACLELDPTGAVITYEEYYPFGSTSYQAGRSVTEVNQKRYRFTGRERDTESGLYYHGARYYAPWIGRWTACDPIGTRDGPSLYVYCRDNPVKLHDTKGTQGNQPETQVTVTYATAPAPGSDSTDPIPRGIPPLSSEAGSPSTVFANQTQSLGTGLQLNDPTALGGSLAYRRGTPDEFGQYHQQGFYPYLDLEVNFVLTGIGGPGQPGAPLPAGGFTLQVSARIAPIPGLPNLTLGVVGSAGPSGESGEPTTASGSEGVTAQYGVKLAPGWGLGVYAAGNRSESSSGPSNYSGTVTPILQYQPNDHTQLVLNPTFSTGTGGSFANQNPYGSFLTGGALVGAQLWSHLILEGGATYTAASSLAPTVSGTGAGGTTPSTHETRAILGIGYTTPVNNNGAPTSVTFMLNPFAGIPGGGSGPGANAPAVGAMFTFTVAWRLPLFNQQVVPDKPAGQ